jgi:DNA invertase Pin-like site-specific DNA recombinase
MRTIFGYVRVSGKAQVDKDGPVRQRTAIMNFTRSGFPGEGLPKFFSDLGVSGTIEGADRPGFIEMLVEAKPGDVIVVENLDRLARDLVVQELIIRELRDRELQLFSADQGFVDLVAGGLQEDPTRTLIRQIFGAIAQFAKSSLVIKLRVARQRKKQLTGRCEGKPKYGQTKGEMILLDLVKKLTESGIKARGIAALFNEQKIQKRQGTKPWHPSEIENLIKRLKDYESCPNVYQGQPPIVGS